MKSKRIVTFLLLIISVSVGVYFSFKYYQAYEKARQDKLLFEKRKIEWIALKQNIQSEISRFNAEVGIVIKDLEMNWEISFNKEKLFPSASLVKIPVMLSCFRAASEGRLKLDRTVKLRSIDKTSGSGMLKDILAGTAFTIEELIGLMIYDSDNTASNMLIDMLGIDYLNTSFKVFGLTNTDLSRKVADFSSRNRGVENYTTAQDMALMLEKIYRRSLISPEISEKCLKLMKLSRMNDRIPAYLPLATVVAHKTGLERGVCHDVGIVFTCKGNFLICVLTKHANSNSKPAKEFIAKIALYTYNYFERL